MASQSEGEKLFFSERREGASSWFTKIQASVSYCGRLNELWRAKKLSPFLGIWHTII